MIIARYITLAGSKNIVCAALSLKTLKIKGGNGFLTNDFKKLRLKLHILIFNI